jgi:hypothetical protein
VGAVHPITAIRFPIRGTVIDLGKQAEPGL